MKSYITRFEEITMRSSKYLPCPVCGRKLKRAKTFTQTVNPYNRNADGAPKTRDEVHEEVRAEMSEWTRTPERHSGCMGGAS